MRTVLLSLVVVGIASCGKVEPIFDAAPIPDSEPEPDATATGDITVQTFARTGTFGTRVDGIEIIAIDPDGRVQLVTTTGGGNATLTITRGATVTALYRPGQLGGQFSGGYLTTFAGVAPGDVLKFGSEFFPSENETGNFVVNFTDLPEATEGYTLYHACGQASAAAGATSIAITRRPSCSPTTQDMLLVALAPPTGATVFNDEVHRFAVMRGVQFSNGSISAPAWQTPTTFTLTASNVPPQVQQMIMVATVVVNGAIQGYSIGLFGFPTAGGAQVTGAWPLTGLQQNTAAAFFTDVGLQYRGFVLDPTATEFNMQEPIALPFLNSLTIDAPTKELRYAIDGDGGHDSTFLRVAYTRAPSTTYAWAVIAPPSVEGMNTFELPDLPAALDEFEIRAGDTVDDDEGMVGILFEYLPVDDYREALQRHEWELDMTESNLEKILFLEGGGLSLFGAFF